MSTVNFNYNGNNIIIQCNAYEKMKDIYSRFSTKDCISPQSLLFLYDGKNVTNIESTLGELMNVVDKERNKMNILASLKENCSSSDFIFEKEIGADESMKDYAKMAILLAMNKYPDDDHEKCTLVIEKFEEKYNYYWDCSFIKDGDSSCHYQDYYMKIRYKNYTIKISKCLNDNN